MTVHEIYYKQLLYRHLFLIATSTNKKNDALEEKKHGLV